MGNAVEMINMEGIWRLHLKLEIIVLEIIVKYQSNNTARLRLRDTFKVSGRARPSDESVTNQ